MREPLSPACERGPAVIRLCRSVQNCIDLFKVLPLCAALLIPSLYSVSVSANTDKMTAQAYSIESPAAQTGLLLDVVRAGQRVLTVGDRGHILYSDNDGQSWLQAKVPTQQLLTAVYFVDQQYGWAVGHDALILATTDAGETWTRQYDDLEQEAPLLDIWFKDRNQGYAVGAYGMLLQTDNGGQDWQRIDEQLDNEEGYHLNAISAVTDAGLFIVGEMGMMFRSADWGDSWEALEGPYQGSLFGIVAGQQPHTLVVYGLRGHIFRSHDFGESWLETKVQTDSGDLQFGLASASFLSSGELVIVGHGGTVLRSENGAESFRMASRADRASLTGVISSTDGGLILVGQNGIHITDAQGNDVAR